MLSIICPWHCSHRGTETGAACLSCHLKLQTYIRGSLPGASSNPPLKIRTSPDSSQPEGASMESCCSASSAHGPARTEAQRVGLLACVATSNFKRTFGGLCRAHPADLLRKCERLLIAHSQKGPLCKAVAQPHLPMALLAQRHREWGCLLVLPPKIQMYLRGSLLGTSSRSAPKMRTSADSSQAERGSLLSCCSASSARGPARTEAQRLGLLAPLATSNFKHSP